jgi:hypothetical protein
MIPTCVFVRKHLCLIFSYPLRRPIVHFPRNKNEVAGFKNVRINGKPVVPYRFGDRALE